MRVFKLFKTLHHEMIVGWGSNPSLWDYGPRSKPLHHEAIGSISIEFRIQI